MLDAFMNNVIFCNIWYIIYGNHKQHAHSRHNYMYWSLSQNTVQPGYIGIEMARAISNIFDILISFHILILLISCSNRFPADIQIHSNKIQRAFAHVITMQSVWVNYLLNSCKLRSLNIYFVWKKKCWESTSLNGRLRKVLNFRTFSL